MPAWERKVDAAGEKILSELHDLAAQAVKVASWANKRFDLRAAMHHRLFRHTNPDAAAAITLGKAASKSIEVKRGIRNFLRLVPTHLFRPGYRVRKANATPKRAWAKPRRDIGDGNAMIAFRSTTVETRTITHELGHTLEYQNRPLFDEAAAFLSAHTKGPKKQLSDGAAKGFNYEPDEYYRPGLSEKREDWRYVTKIYPGQASNPSIGPYPVDGTELISSGLEWLQYEPETLFVEVPAFADFLLRRVVLRPKD